MKELIVFIISMLPILELRGGLIAASLLNLNIVSTLILSIVLYLFANFIKDKLKFFNKICIPTPVIGGLFFSILIFLLKKFGLLEITMDTSLMPYFLSAFFISIGFCINIFSAKGGGKLLFIYWLLCAILGLCQNLISVFASKLLHITPLLGFMCGSVSMEGGHGYALAFGTTIESIGIENAVAIGIDKGQNNKIKLSLQFALLSDSSDSGGR